VRAEKTAAVWCGERGEVRLRCRRTDRQTDRQQRDRTGGDWGFAPAAAGRRGYGERQARRLAASERPEILGRWNCMLGF
jgi:hypothetical protein